MIKELTIEKYRGFNHFTIKGLQHINLFVGKNNSGKTSLLEAFYLFSMKNIDALATIATMRGECMQVDGDARSDISHFFYGHTVTGQSSFTLTSDIGKCVIDIVSRENMPEVISQSLASYPIEWALHMKSTQEEMLQSEEMGIVALSAGKALLASRNNLQRMDSSFPLERMIDSGIRFIAPGSLDGSALNTLWNQILLQGDEKLLVGALQILDPTVESIAFLLNTTTRSSQAYSNIVIGFENGSKRLPLGTLGDGMRRLLAIILAVTCAKGGVLFIDEVDAGMHYSVMADLWRLIIQTAMKRDVQIFASTHSLDCLKGLAEACDDDNQSAASVALCAINPALSHATTYTGAEIKIAVQNEIEVR